MLNVAEIILPKITSLSEKLDYLCALIRKEIRWPITTEGMGIDFSNDGAVNAATDAGFTGTLSASLVGRNDVYNKLEPGNFSRNVALSHQANEKAILREIAAVREQHPYGPLGVNLMKAVSDYENLVRVIGESNQVDFLIVGAGLPTDLPQVMKRYPNMHYIPIVSSARAAEIIITKACGRDGKGKDGRLPAAFYIELPQYAGGHLGAKDEVDALDAEKFNPEKIRDEIAQFTPEIPLILGGGITSLKEIDLAISQYGYDGVGIGTLALLTQESGLPDHLLKRFYLNPDSEIITGMTSPAGLPSTYIDNPIMWEKAARTDIMKETRRECVSCIGNHRCGFLKGTKKYCIAHFLSATRRGEEWGLFFTGRKLAELRKHALYLKNGLPYIPSMAEMRDFLFEQKLPAHFTVK